MLDKRRLQDWGHAYYSTVQAMASEGELRGFRIFIQGSHHICQQGT